MPAAHSSICRPPVLTLVGVRAVAVVWLAFLCGLCALPVAAAPKTDVVHLKNGDRITCEIKSLDRARLTLKTDAMDTIEIHWQTIAALTSPRQFEIELTTGSIHYGSLAPGAPGEMTVTSLGGTVVGLRLWDVIRLTPIGTSLWGRMDGSVDVGFSFNQANLETRWTLNGSATYRSHRYSVGGSIASQLTTREDADRLSRNTLSLNARRMMADRWFTLGLGQFQQNQELDLDLRALGGGGGGRYFSQTNRRLLSGFAGLVYTHERFAGEPAGSSAEAVVGGSFDFFTPGNDDLTFTNTVVSFYNLGGRGRARVELESALHHKFFKDVYWSLNGFESFDSTPPEDQKQNDAGVSITLGWKF